MDRATPQSILDWARDRLGLGAGQLGRLDGIPCVLAYLFGWVLGKKPSGGIALKRSRSLIKVWYPIPFMRVGTVPELWAPPKTRDVHPKPLNPSVINREYKVAEFIDPSSRTWNLDLLSNFISDSESDTISKIYVRPLLSPDKLVWPYERNGSFSVKFGYWRNHSRHPCINLDRPSSSRSVHPRIWVWLWSCKAPPKMKNFL
ncbi:hypothetical protein PS2_007578 [Malus domestica]